MSAKSAEVSCKSTGSIYIYIYKLVRQSAGVAQKVKIHFINGVGPFEAAFSVFNFFYQTGVCPSEARTKVYYIEG